MDDSPWQELDIEPTTEEAVIRRAYAARLKTINSDLDPARFMRLRRAYESALSLAQEDWNAPYDEWQNTAYPEDDTLAQSDVRRVEEQNQVESRYVTSIELENTSDGPSGTRPTYSSDAGLPKEMRLAPSTLDEFTATFEEEIRQANTGSACVILLSALAQGVIPIGQEELFIERLLKSALENDELSADALDSLGKTLEYTTGALGKRTIEEGLNELRARAAALRWLASMKARAKSERRPVRNYLQSRFVSKMRLAIAFLRGRFDQLKRTDRLSAIKEFQQFELHAKWLGARIEREKITLAYRAWEERTRPTIVRAALSLFFLICTGVFAQVDQLGLLVLTSFALACLCIGHWLLTLFGILIMIGVIMIASFS